MLLHCAKKLALARNVLFLSLTVSLTDVSAAQSSGDLQSLKSMSLEMLTHLSVSTASKKPQQLTDTAAAVFVITDADIRRLGLDNIPNALRMVPGMQVGQITNNTWAISARGFNGNFSNKLLVQVDGRSVYNRLWSGVFWDAQSLMMADIDRIEIVRGPGGTAWGANAVNGVVNIIMKDARQTQGMHLSVTAGNLLNSAVDARLGGEAGGGYYRIWGRHVDRGDSLDNNFDEGWQSQQVGLRYERQVFNDHTQLTVQGDALNSTFESDFGFFQSSDLNTSRNLLVSLENQQETSGWSFTSYYDRVTREDFSLYDSEIEQFDVSFEHRTFWRTNQEVVWGVTYRKAQDTTTINGRGSLVPPTDDSELMSAFFQNETVMFDASHRLTVGAKIERNGYTGIEVQPNVRWLWHPDDRSSLWTGWSRAVRTPSRAERDLQLNAGSIPALSPENPSPYPIVLALQPNTGFGAEHVDAYELGYRLQINERASVDAVLFQHRYQHLRTLGTLPTQCLSGSGFPLCPPGDSYLSAFQFDNRADAHSYGLEVSTDMRLSTRHQLKFAYTYIKIDVDPHDPTDTTTEIAETQTPRHQAGLQWFASFGDRWRTSVWLRYVDKLDLDYGTEIDAYTDLDLNLAYAISADIDVSLHAAGLLGEHAEYRRELLVASAPPEERRKAWFAKLEWRL